MSHYTFEQGSITIYHPNILIVVVILFAYILAEIFKEGNRLAEENSLTV